MGQGEDETSKGTSPFRAELTTEDMVYACPSIQQIPSF